MKLKALWYCTKPKKSYYNLQQFNKKNIYFCSACKFNALNGKIVCVSDYEVEEIKSIETPEYAGSECNTFLYDVSLRFETKTMTQGDLLVHSCVSGEELYKYKPNYAIHIKNLVAFDKPKELSDYYKTFEPIIYRPLNETHSSNSTIYTPKNEIYFFDYCDELKKAPQNMMYVYDKDGVKYVLISIHPECLCRILNGFKDVELRKKVLKEML